MYTVNVQARHAMSERHRRRIRIALVAVAGLALLICVSLGLIIRFRPEWLLFPGWDLRGGVHGTAGQ
jgi:hypothetical protein